MKAYNIEDILRYGEHITLECKKSKREVPKSVWETYSSLYLEGEVSNSRMQSVLNLHAVDKSGSIICKP